MSHKVFDIDTREGYKLVIKVLEEPNGAECEHHLDTFFKKHTKFLSKVKDPKSVLCYFDIRVLTMSLQTMSYIPRMVTHFSSTVKKLSDQKLKACSVCVSSETVASAVQKYVEMFPGEVPTFVSTDETLCKQFLYNHNKKKTVKDVPKELPKELPKDALKESPKESPKDAPKESPKKSPKEPPPNQSPLEKRLTADVDAQD